MSGFMNAEIESIRNNLECSCCGVRFAGSPSQARKFKYEGRRAICSDSCRKIEASKKIKAKPVFGPCPTCGNHFESRAPKIFCSLKCYNASPQFKEMSKKNMDLSEESREKIRQALKKGDDVACVECGKMFYQKPASKSRPAKKFCCTPCYRSYMAKRFDRWIASPEGIALPQCYDEFLDKEVLPCVVEGCQWSGRHLSLHMNQAHGMPAKEFKQAAGFNATTGVVSKPLAVGLRARQITGIAIMNQSDRSKANRLSVNATIGTKRSISLEGKEHLAKSRMMLPAGPIKTCPECGGTFKQKSVCGNRIYCSNDCRDNRFLKVHEKIPLREKDGTFRWVSPGSQRNKLEPIK